MTRSTYPLSLWRAALASVKNVALGVQHILYPAFCMHCEAALASPARVLCDACVSVMCILQPEGRCRLCYSELENETQIRCKTCLEDPPCWKAGAACCDYEGPARTLVTRLKYGNLRHLAEGMGSYFVAQLALQDWPLPDVITPVPSPWFRRLLRGYNQSFLLAETMGRLLNIPVYETVSRSQGDLPQAGLSQQQRRQLVQHSFRLRKKRSIKDKTVLLIDDVCTSGRTLRACADTLLEGYPQDIYAMTFARAL